MLVILWLNHVLCEGTSWDPSRTKCHQPRAPDHRCDALSIAGPRPFRMGTFSRCVVWQSTGSAFIPGCQRCFSPHGREIFTNCGTMEICRRTLVGLVTIPGRADAARHVLSADTLSEAQIIPGQSFKIPPTLTITVSRTLTSCNELYMRHFKIPPHILPVDLYRICIFGSFACIVGYLH